MPQPLPLLLLVLMALTPQPSAAQAPAGQLPSAVLEGEIGWGGWIRQGRWNLARADVQADSPVGVDFEWYVPQTGRRSMRIDLEVVLNPRARTIQALLPVGPMPQAIHLNVRSQSTGRLLGHWQDPDPQTLPDRLVPETTLFVAVAGQGAAVSALNDSRLTVGIDRAIQLPSSPIGYDAFDVVVLDRVNLETLSNPQQQALLSWVQGGGRLLLQLDLGVLPDASPLQDALPTRPRRATGADGEPRVVIDDEGERPLSTVPVGSGMIGVLQVNLEKLPVSARADLIHRFGQRPRENSTSAPQATHTAPAPGRQRSGVLLIILAIVVGPVDALLARLGGRRLRRWTILPAVVIGIGGIALLVAGGEDPGDSQIPPLENLSPPAVVEAVGRPAAITKAIEAELETDARQWWRLGGTPQDSGALVDIDFEQTPTSNVPASDRRAPYRVDLR